MMDIKNKTSAKCGDVTTLANKSKNQIRQNQQLPEELHKPIIRIILKKNSLFHIYRQYLGCWSSWYAINKQVYWLNQIFIMFN